MTLAKPLITLIVITLLTYHTVCMSHIQQPTHHNLRTHTFSPSVSNQLSTAIRNKMYLSLIIHSISNLPSFSDQQFAQQLKQDLNQQKDSQRKLKQISLQSVQELFKIFGLKGIKCDNNNDGIITKEELQCLNFIWKYYVPQDSELGN